MDKIVVAPRPTEDRLLQIVVKEIAFPNGRTMKLALSQWHWDMVAFIELWDQEYGRKHGLIYEYLQMEPDLDDAFFSDVVMLTLRNKYNAWLAQLSPGQDPSFPDPRG